MKNRTGKIIRLSFLFLVSAIILLSVLSVLLRDQVAEMIIKTVNERISVKLYVESFRLSLIRNFPKATVELNNIVLLSSPGINRKEFPGYNTDTLLKADRMNVSFSLKDIIKGNYNIERIGIISGQMKLFSDSSGIVNYNITKKNNTGTGKEPGEFSIILDRLILNSVSIIYINRSTNICIDGHIKNGKLSSRISNNSISLASQSSVSIHKIEIDRIKSSLPFDAGFDIKMDYSEQVVSIRKGSLSVEGIKFNVKGKISDNDEVNLNIAADKIDLSEIKKYIPLEYSDKLKEYIFSGNMKIDSRITGKYSRLSNPHFEIICMLDNGSFRYIPSGLTVNNIYFNGNYSNGSRNNQESTVISFSDLKFKIGSANYSGSFRLSNFYNPVTSVDLQGKIIPSEMLSFFKTDNINSVSGDIDAEIRFETSIKLWDSLTVNDIIRIKPYGHLRFNNLTATFKDPDFNVNNTNGEITLTDQILAKNLDLIYKSQKIFINGSLSGLYEWLDGQNVMLKTNADIHFSRLNPDIFIPRSATEKKDEAYKLPDDLQLDLRIKIDTLNYTMLPAGNVTLRLLYKPGLITFNSLFLNAFGGNISGNGFLVQNKDKSYISKGIFDVRKINIRHTFNTFRNFGQDFIKAENLGGDLTGNFTILLPLDSLFRPLPKSMVSEGAYSITDGELKDFEPVKELSSFIELSELQDIRFDKIENEFFIRNNSFYLPVMQVNSSAADLTINGKHSFDNSFEYHVKILLSELLSNKNRKRKKQVTEFGAIEDDGLGRTSLLLKVTGKGDEMKVSYDVKAAGDKVKAGIKSEKQNLKKILNEEYGFFKKDSVTEKKSPEKKPRFRISWDGSDTSETLPAEDTIKKERQLKSLFRKK